MKLKSFLWNLTVTLALPVLWLAAALPARRRDTLVWGSRPIISFSYWAKALQAAGHPSISIMQDVFAINRASDFNILFRDLAPRWLPQTIAMGIGTLRALMFVLRRGKVLHMPYEGFALHWSCWWFLESRLLRTAGVRSVILPYGADFYAYSRVIDPSARHGLLATYPAAARNERAIRRKIEHWNAVADAVLPGYQLDGEGRWDVLMPSMFAIDTQAWQAKREYSDADGVNASVSILHTPNHRGFKGTEFLVAAVEELQAEGLKVDLLLLERMPNEQVREKMQSVDILAEQFIATAYAMSGIEGMASGLPVLANLDHEAYTRLFRRFSFLDECPIVSTPPERLRDTLRILVRNPELRRTLGKASRAYAEKYHSFETAQFVFGSIYKRIVDGEDIDLIHLFHPLLSPYNRAKPRIDHPLSDNRLPASLAS